MKMYGGLSRQLWHQRQNLSEGRCRYGKSHSMDGSPYKGTCLKCRIRMREASRRDVVAQRVTASRREAAEARSEGARRAPSVRQGRSRDEALDW
jgi:hypothetical protein